MKKTGFIDSNKYKLLLNGIELKDPVSTNGIPFLEGVNLSNIDRIEVISGTQGALYGSDAIAGVIQIFTKNKTGENFIKTSVGNNFNKTELGLSSKLYGADIILNASKVYENQKSWITGTISTSKASQTGLRESVTQVV